MMKKITSFRCLIAIVLLCFVFFNLSVSALTVQEKSKGLTLSPLRSELNIEPGTLLDGTLKVTNSTDKPMAVTLSAEEFSVINQQYDYAFTVESNVAKWVTFSLNEVDLVAGESKDVTFTVGVPLSAEPGGRYISLFASTDTNTSDVGVNSRQRIASLLYITVIGEVSRAGNLVSLTSPWAISGESKFSTAIQNTGTTHFRSRYNVKIKNLVGNGEVLNMSSDALILPGTIRLVTDNLPLPQFPGVYKIIYTIGLGDTPAVVETRYLLYLPIYATVLLIAVITALCIFLFRKRLKKIN